MASVFKLGRDKGKRNACWYFEYVDHRGKKRMKKGFTDKSLTKDLANKMELESRQRKLGLIDPDGESRAQKQKSRIDDHLKHYEKSLNAKENTDKHIKLTMGRIRRIVTGCEFELLRDLNADDVETFLTEMREEDNIGYRTYNHYLQAIDGWCNWMISRQRLDRNPLVGIPRLNAALDVRHPRRALSLEEITQLLHSARTSDKTIQCFSGEERARIYTISYMTGLRRKEIASLTPRSFELDAKQPTLSVEARSSKHRKKDVLPVHPDLVPLIKEWTVGLKQNQPLFVNLAKRRTWLMVKKDLERVGIPYKNEDGIADFHAAGRHTHITELLRNGATLPEARELARHSDVRMTMRYTHISLDDQAKALKSVSAPPSCQDIVRNSCTSSGQSAASRDNERQSEEAGSEDANPSEKGVCDAECHPVSPGGKENEKWRRRGSNPHGEWMQLLRCETFRRRRKTPGSVLGVRRRHPWSRFDVHCQRRRALRNREGLAETRSEAP